ncbi:hypothetical protein FHS68_003941 [Dyadobacter arcticus]|uniref:Uncharacterized protein n=1 Tax=Dyadobacter arcticus TaxID=1078754 RepID=A0ABX0UP46_9BACT|nr:hypothetical protein [Dyadobacter arcticus]
MNIVKPRGKPDLEVLLSASFATLINLIIADISFRSFGLLISPAIAFYTAMLINEQADQIKLKNQQKRYEANLSDEIKNLEIERLSCSCEYRKKEIAEELKKYRQIRFESNIEKLESVKPDYQRISKSRRTTRR